MESIIQSDKIKEMVRKINENFSTIESNKVGTTTFNSQLNSLQNLIDLKLDLSGITIGNYLQISAYTTSISFFTGTTFTNALSQKLDITGYTSSINFLTGTTLPNTYIDTTYFRNYSGSTQLNSWQITGNTFTGEKLIGSKSGSDGIMSFILSGNKIAEFNGGGQWIFRSLSANTSNFKIESNGFIQLFSVNNSGLFAFGNAGGDWTPETTIDIYQATANNAQLRLRSPGVMPTSPKDGDIWNIDSVLYFRCSADTKTFLLSSGITTTATAGAATLPANPEGFIVINIPNVGNKKIPYYGL